MRQPLLEVRNLCIAIDGPAATEEVVRGVSFTIEAGQTLALVGESGSGKSLSARALMGLLPPAARHCGGFIAFAGESVLDLDERALRRLRGDGIGMIFQEPMSSLNPLHTVEHQIAEVLRLHRGLRGAAARERVLELLDWVGLDERERRLGCYPHELSGGQRQRVMIAVALACEPQLLIADEPTTALDVTVEAQILQLLGKLQARIGMAVLLITHDLGVVRDVADRVCVMRAGEIVETGETAALFADPQHPYTRHLIAAEPSGEPPPVVAGEERLRLEGLRVRYPIRGGVLGRARGYVEALKGASVSLRVGETLGVVGESGSGKSTLAQAVLRLIASEGGIHFLGEDIQRRRQRQLRALRAQMQLVFQDPFAALSPRMSVAQLVGEGLAVHRGDLGAAARARRVDEALASVELDPAVRERYAHEFSGGQRQRIAIARAIVLSPSLLVLDEPTSALDRSIQAQVLELLLRLQRERQMSYVFISHDLKVVRAISHQLLVMRGGEVVEQGPAAAIFAAPRSDYTRRLMRAAFEHRAVVG